MNQFEIVENELQEKFDDAWRIFGSNLKDYPHGLAGLQKTPLCRGYLKSGFVTGIKQELAMV